MKKGNSILLTLILVTTLGFIFGCSPKLRHRVLNVVFEIPKDSLKATNLKEPKMSLSSDTAKTKEVSQKIISAQGNIHPPYLSGECKVCHDDGMRSRVRIKQPDLCYECHSNFKDKYKYLHGPVAGGYCTSCHSPHFSKNAKLVLRTGQQLCLQCHNKESVLKNDVHKDIAETNCTECHNPHGGDDKLILK